METALVLVNGVGRFKNLLLPHGFSTKGLGNMSYNWGPEEEVTRSVELFYSQSGLSREYRAHMLPEHGDTILVVGDSEAKQIVKCDGLITTRKGLTLSLCPADCFPIIITSDVAFERGFPVPQVVALIHAGWRGTDKQIAKKAIEMLCTEFSLAPSDLNVFIGPGIGFCCYDEDIDAKRKENWKPFVRTLLDEDQIRQTVDLLSFNVLQLLESGVPIEQITMSGLCTYCSCDSNGKYVYFSHHRAKHTKEKEGRFVAAVAP